MNSEKNERIHEISVNMRRKMELSGVSEVISFDDESANFRTVCGDMCVEGKGIRIGVLDTERGVVTLEGRIDAIIYSDDEEPRRQGLFGKLLK